MRYLRVKTIRDEITGELGFKLKDNKMPNDGQHVIGGNGLIIAHDIIEHQQGLKKVGITLEDEVIAFGGIIYTRGMTGNIGGIVYSAEETLAIELADFFRYYNNIKLPSKFYPKKRDHEELLEHDFVYDTIDKMKKILKENSYEEYFTSEDNKESLIETYAEWIKHNLKYGIWLAEKRYGCSFEAYSMFKSIKNTVDNYSPSWEGQEFILGYQKDKATMRELEEHEYENSYS